MANQRAFLFRQPSSLLSQAVRGFTEAYHSYVDDFLRNEFHVVNRNKCDVVNSIADTS